MKINFSASARPPKFADADLSKTYGQLIGKITEDDVLAIVLREAEVKVAQAIRRDWSSMDDTITSDIEINTKSHTDMFTDGWESAVDEVIDYLRTDRTYLDNELALARAHLALCDKVIAALTDADSASEFPHAYGAAGPRQGVALHYLAGSVAALRRAKRRMAAADQRWDEGFDRIVAQATARNKFVATSDSIQLTRIDALRPESFEEISAWLLQRDGCTILRSRGGAGDQGADVIATTPDGLRIVLQCKHSIKESKRIDTKSVYELNGTARPVHGADIVGIVTNRRLTDAAESFAVGQGIHVIDRRVLKRWATYGVPWWRPEDLPVVSVVEAATPDGQTTASPSGEVPSGGEEAIPTESGSDGGDGAQ